MGFLEDGFRFEMSLDAHYHRHTFETYLGKDELLVRAWGFHPWQVDEEPVLDIDACEERLVLQLHMDSIALVGETGLDRLRSAIASPRQHAFFEMHLRLAHLFQRPVVVHGAKCWGEVVQLCAAHRGVIPSFLFHGFSRSAGLLTQIRKLNGFISVGPQVLNDHAVNYHALVRALPLEMLLIETDFDETDPAQGGIPAREALAEQILLRVAMLRALSPSDLRNVLIQNLYRFLSHVDRTFFQEES